MNGNQDALVSVIVLTYNHEKYIAQALDRIVEQQTEFKYEILVGDDCSTDRTAKIVLEYQNRYPNLIKAFCHSKNKGPSKNYYYMIQQAKGKYLACCEGDDYWCDANRLQRDIDFLENNSEYSAVYNKCHIVDEDGKKIEESSVNPRVAFWRFDKSVYELNDFEHGRIPGHANAATRRNYFKNKNKDYTILYKEPSSRGDLTTALFDVLNGKVHVSEHYTLCYRFRVTSMGENFLSLYQRKNLKVQDYDALCRMEKWALKEFNVIVNAEPAKKDRFIGAIVIWLKAPTAENRKVVRKIVALSGRPIAGRFLVAKVCFLKMYYWKILKTDKPIKI